MNIFLNGIVGVVRAAPPPVKDPPAYTSTTEPLQIADMAILFTRIVYIVIAVTGMMLFIMLIMGGVKFITAGGEPEKLQSARKTLTFAIAGAVIVACAYLIIILIEKITGVPVSQFDTVVR